jgi:hypothetical protein
MKANLTIRLYSCNPRVNNDRDVAMGRKPKIVLSCLLEDPAWEDLPEVVRETIANGNASEIFLHIDSITLEKP